MPAALAGLTLLNELSLEGNDIAPASWQLLPRHLLTLNLSWRGMKQVPAVLTSFLQVRELNLGNNQITRG